MGGVLDRNKTLSVSSRPESTKVKWAAPKDRPYHRWPNFQLRRRWLRRCQPGGCRLGIYCPGSHWLRRNWPDHSRPKHHQPGKFQLGMGRPGYCWQRCHWPCLLCFPSYLEEFKNTYVVSWPRRKKDNFIYLIVLLINHLEMVERKIKFAVASRKT